MTSLRPLRLCGERTSLSSATRCIAAQTAVVEPMPQELIRDPVRFIRHECAQAAYLWLEVDALTKPMRVREESPDYGTHRRDAENAEECP